ncbi:MAG: bifunctional adenosylcobinamide kinase/adenosylcobinamide-phosphate guanylyltransferase [Eubacteriales bacterium]|nr:bifunctional adenosylcobinamide kinase/adenosylcobinamide-phosphate guanylyltransferase [Lachnospiraceae bacterium]MDO5128000.1 bifunctional adenosylcobinamide kinase/adenosylcobinamide-phosphate guanylyltransferase [Eubacteriales bacterium]
MIFVIGGYAQGKRAYVEREFSKDYVIFDAYHLQVKEQMMHGKDPLACAKELLDKEKVSGEQYIVISDEIGYGLVPVDKKDRMYREENGRVNIFFADHATDVYRVVAGIAQKIK